MTKITSNVQPYRPRAPESSLKTQLTGREIGWGLRYDQSPDSIGKNHFMRLPFGRKLKFLKNLSESYFSYGCGFITEFPM